MAIFEDRSITFSEFERQSNALSRLLLSKGIGLSERVLTSCEPSIALLVLFGALAKIGAVFVPSNPALSASEFADVVECALPHALIGDLARSHILSSQSVPSFHLETLIAESAGVSANPPECDAPHENDPHVIFFTSGSSGRPKGAVLSHRLNMLRTHPGALLLPRGKTVCAYPLFHMSAWTIALQCWQARDAIVLVRGGDAEAICRAITKYKATQINAIPAIWQRIVDFASEHKDEIDLSCLSVVDTGTSATPLDLLEAISKSAPNARLRVFYGSTEAGSVAMLEHEDVGTHPGSCGKPTIYTETKLSDETELLVRGPLVFSGYFGDPLATANAFDGEWYRTGDLAQIDEQGYLSITGRAGNLIRSGGEGVSPGEVEDVLRTHHAVNDVAVIGLPHPRWGEVICAVVVAKEGESVSLAQLRSHCEGVLTSFKHPRALMLTSEIPRTPATNQIQRRALLTQALQKTTQIEGLA
jgi:acyl-CoA synthetase (AMP-forming)/AMP-acid ligase II